MVKPFANTAESFVTHLKIAIITNLSGYNFQRGGNGGVGLGSTKYCLIINHVSAP